MNEREFLERISPALDGFWEYICRVTNGVPFKNGDLGRGGRMLIMLPPSGTVFKFDIAAERLWETTDPETNENNRAPLPNAVPWKGEGTVVYTDNELSFEYFPSDVAGKGVTKDTIRLIRGRDELFVGIGEFNHLHEDGTQTIGAVQLRKMDNADDFSFAPKGIRPAGSIIELKKGAQRARQGQVGKPRRESLVVTMAGNGVLVIGSGNAITSGPSRLEIGVGDLGALKGALEALRVSPEDRDDLERILTTEKPKDGTLGKGAADWIGRMVTKGITGVWEVGKDVSSALLSEILLRYYGLKP